MAVLGRPCAPHRRGTSERNPLIARNRAFAGVVRTSLGVAAQLPRGAMRYSGRPQVDQHGDERHPADQRDDDPRKPASHGPAAQQGCYSQSRRLNTRYSATQTSTIKGQGERVSEQSVQLWHMVEFMP